MRLKKGDRCKLAVSTVFGYRGEVVVKEDQREAGEDALIVFHRADHVETRTGIALRKELIKIRDGATARANS